MPAGLGQMLGSDHHRGELGGGRLGGGHRAGVAAVSQHRHPVGVAQYLLHLVRDQHHRVVLIGHVADDLEELVALLRGQYGRRFVEDQNPGAPVQLLEDLHPLLLPHRQLPYVGTRIHAEAVLLGDTGHAALHRPQRQAHALVLEPEHQVLGHGERGHQAEVLVHHADPVRGRVVGRAQAHPLPIDAHLARVGPVQAGEDRAERRLARPVLAQQPVDLAGAQIEIHPIVGGDAEERLVEVADFEDRLADVSQDRDRNRCRLPAGPATGPAGPVVSLRSPRSPR